jgi:hypothetical protein
MPFEDLTDLLNENMHSMHREIIEEILPEVMRKFVSAGRDYGDSYKLLGEKGQFSDINRKFWKLYNAIWLDQPMIGESVEQIIEDIIGHCLILLYLRGPESDQEESDDDEDWVDMGTTTTTPTDPATAIRNALAPFRERRDLVDHNKSLREHNRALNEKLKAKYAEVLELKDELEARDRDSENKSDGGDGSAVDGRSYPEAGEDAYDDERATREPENRPIIEVHIHPNGTEVR